MTHVKHLRVETEEELEVLAGALAYVAADPAVRAETSRVAARLHDRLQAAPAARHGGVVHVEDAMLAPSRESV